MERLTSITVTVDNGNINKMEWKRTVVDQSLSWTLGDRWRTKEEYDGKITAMGGGHLHVSNQKSELDNMSIII